MRGLLQDFLQAAAFLLRELFISYAKLFANGVAEHIEVISGSTQCPFCHLYYAGNGGFEK